MPTINFEEIKSSNNKALLDLKTQKYAPAFAIVPSEQQMNQGDVFGKDYDRHSFTILKQEDGKYKLGRRENIPAEVQREYSQTLFQIMITALRFITLDRLESDIMPQQFADYMLNSLIINERKEISYVNTFIGVKFVIHWKFLGEFYKLEGISGCITVNYLFKKGHFMIDSISYIGCKMFEKIIDLSIANDHTAGAELRSCLLKLKKRKVSIGDSSSALNINNIETLAIDSRRGGDYFDTKNIQNLIAGSYLKTSKIMNRFYHKKDLSFKRLELMDFILDVLQRLFINQIKSKKQESNEETIKNVLLIFKDINTSFTKEYGSFVTGAGKLDATLKNIMKNFR